jgi:membrane fusion protein, heavy metal efflux system
MKSVLVISALAASILAASCGSGKQNTAAEAPPSAQVVEVGDLSLFHVDHPEQFQLTTAVTHDAVSQLTVTGVVNPDISRTVPVISLASGRVVDIQARLGDSVEKGQLLLRVRSDDVSGGFSDYRKAVADELYARQQLGRAQELFAHGAIAQTNLEAAQDTEDDAKATLEAASEHLRLLGNDPDKPSGIVDIVAPASGVITDQEVTNASSVQAYSAPNPFTISDLSSVWIICDVYENDLPSVHVGQTADIRLNAYPGQIFKGTISNIGQILDPSIRTAKVRLEVKNPGFMRVGMFATATFYGRKMETHTAVPAAAILHLHDRDWVFLPAEGQKFHRTEVTAGDQLSNQMQEIISGLQPGQRLVGNALALQNAIDND